MRPDGRSSRGVGRGGGKGEGLTDSSKSRVRNTFKVFLEGKRVRYGFENLGFGYFSRNRMGMGFC